MAAPKKIKPNSSISKLLKSASEDNKKKKSGACVVDSFRGLADEMNDLKIAFEDAEAAFRTKEVELLNVANNLYSEHATSDFSKSFNFVGDETPGVQVVFTDKFSEMPAEVEPAIREQMGDKFDNYFQENRKLELTQTDDATIKLLMDKLGEEKFLEIFKIKVTVGVKADMDRKQFELPASVRAMLKQNKASVKLIKE